MNVTRVSNFSKISFGNKFTSKLNVSEVPQEQQKSTYIPKNLQLQHFGISFTAKKQPKQIDDGLYVITKAYKYVREKNPSMYGAPYIEVPAHDGYSLRTINGYVKTQEINDDIIEQLVLRPKSISQSLKEDEDILSIIEDFLVRKDRISEAIAIRKANPDAGKSEVLPNYLVKQGRLNEAKQIMTMRNDSLSDIRMSSILNEYGINKNGEIYNYELIEPKDNSGKYKALLDETEKKADEKYGQVLNRTEKSLQSYDSLPVIGKNRPLKAILTLGVSEAIRHNKKMKIKKCLCDEIEANKREKIQDINDKAKADADRYSEETKKYYENSKKQEFVTKAKASIKADLQTGLIAKLTQLNKGKNVFVPNCVMFYGEQPYISQEFAKWIAETSDSDFAMVRSDINNDKMEKDIKEALKTSQTNWERINKRSIIFVEGMEKLINKKESSAEDIAEIKELMKTANENHATIVFHSCNPVNLETSVITSNRVGLKVNVPIKYNDTKIEI